MPVGREGLKVTLERMKENQNSNTSLINVSSEEVENDLKQKKVRNKIKFTSESSKINQTAPSQRPETYVGESKSKPLGKVVIKPPQKRNAFSKSHERFTNYMFYCMS
ncbi:hypothetical protein [Metabacillus endolithicus]|uniref:Uncharacterized protein n=1 Tax=Metabacillus endolithicus TaxID=1535204 RepID=A0ABW5C280_9BACI|nr:hypothetical protein [Metabacillus endolithicus]UPG65530.1 hypothetical protein MVE64_11475 [Metabacillus endolithicus]